MFGLGIKEAVIIALVLIILYGLFARPKRMNSAGSGMQEEKTPVRDGEIEEK